MSSSHSRVIEAAVRTLSDNAELKLSATELLGRTSGSPSEDAIARWDAVDAKKRGPARRWLPWAILAVVSALMWLADSKEMIAYFQWVKWLRNSSYSERPDAQAEQRTASRLDARGKLLVFGDLASRDNYRRKEKLWQSDSENPAYFAEYAAMFQYSSLPPDFIQTARRLDPDNAWFIYLAASVQAGRHEMPPNGALALLHEARSQTKYTNYKADLLRQRIPLLPQENLMERFESMLNMNHGLAVSVDMRELFQTICRVASDAGERGDVPAFQEHVREGVHLLRGIYQDEVSSLEDERYNAESAGFLVHTFAETAEKLKLQEEADAWKKISNDFGKRNVRPYEFTVDGKVINNLKKVAGSMPGGPTDNIPWNVLATPLPLTDADVKPSRLLDHEILSRFFNYICWLVMALCLGLAATYRFQVSKLSRRLAARMTELLQSVDWAWIVGLGILLPFAFVMGINRLTPLGGREFSMMGAAKLMPAGHFLGLLLLWLVVPVQVIRWRLARRAGGFGFCCPSRIGWVAVACAAAFVPWIGWVAITGRYPDWWAEWVRPPAMGCGTSGLPASAMGIQLDQSAWLPQLFWPQLVLLGFPVLWLCGLALRALSVRVSRQFHQEAAARVLAVSWAAALGVLCIASQGFKAAERYWIARDELGRMDPARPACSVYEYRTAAQLRKEMLEILHLPTS